ncbi:MAG: ATP-binding cassette domain-containing protein [Verrucomicrobiae bacterium]|nr:ATP-binding cassette domain-containing protein [Verrucomicrobiae bacterium]
MSSLLSINRLTLGFLQPDGGKQLVLRDVSCHLDPGEILCVVGGVGAGKSVLLRSLCGLLPRPIRLVRGQATLDPGSGSEVNLLRPSSRQLTSLRRHRLAVLHRDIAGQWNPTMTMRQHVMETIALMGKSRQDRREANWMPTIYEVGLIEPETLLGRYPGQLAEVILQRFAIALGLLKGADLWIADEPTSALDALGEDQILKLLRELCERHRFGLMLATHHFGVAERVADRVAVLFEGCIVDAASANEIVRRPLHRYTRALLDCLPCLGEQRARLGEVDRVAERDALETEDPA